MSRYRAYSVNADGWTDWIKPEQPKPRGVYKLACCDCGLVHDVQFRVDRDGDEHVVVMRLRRNNRSTAAMRRKPRGEH